MGIIQNYWFPTGLQLHEVFWFHTLGAEYFSPTAETITPEIAERYQFIEHEGERVCRITCKADDPVGALFSKRSEVGAEHVDNRAPISNWTGYEDSRRWYHYKVMLPADWVPEAPWQDTLTRSILFQVHDDADSSPADVITTPPLWMLLDSDGRFHFQNTSCAATATTSNNYVRTTRPKVRLLPGVPADFVVRARWAWDNTGELEIWMNGRKILSQIGEGNCFNNDPSRGGGPMYSLFGAYCQADAVDRSYIHWGCQVGDEEFTTLNEFMEACGSSLREREGFVTRGVSL